MADRDMYPSNSGGSVGRVYTEIKLKLNGASNPTVLAGGSFLRATQAALHPGGGNIVNVTMRDAWLEVVAHACDVRDDAGNGSYATIGNFANESSQAVPALPVTFRIQTFNGAGTSQNDSTLVIVIALALRNSNVTYGN